MRLDRASKCLLVLLMWASPIAAQNTVTTNWTPRVFLDADIGLAGRLGFKRPSTDFGLSFEFPLGKRFEIQAGSSYSPDKKKITHDGHSISANGKGIFWINRRVGALGEIGYSQLWTSQFNEGGFGPLVGAVIRTWDLPARTYFTYTIPTGCVWATPSNPCRLQSKRLQGITGRQEFQLAPHLRIGLELGLYHFCDQSNPTDRAAGRICHIAGTEYGFVRIQFPGWRKSEPY